MERTPKMLRLTPDTAQAVESLADYEGLSDNAWITAAIERAIARRRGDADYMSGLAKHFAGKLEQLEP